MYHLFIISSLNDPIYRKVHRKRRQLLKRYKISYTVLINHPESDLDDKESTTLIPLEEDEILYNGQGYNPFMAQKFLLAVKMLFRSYREFKDVPNYIVRTNATTYVHYPSLHARLESPDFPRERVLAGPYWNDQFVQGMIMIFSKDVLKNMLEDNRMYDKDLMRLNDDVSLSVLSQPYCDWYYLSEHLIMSSKETADTNGVYQLDKIQPRENNKWIFRIAHLQDRAIDLENWDQLLSYFNESNEPNEPRQWKWYYITGILFMIMIVVIAWILYVVRHARKNTMTRASDTSFP